VSTALRPNTVKIERRMASTPSVTGSDVPGSPTTINAAIPAHLERDPKGTVAQPIDTTVFMRDAFLLMDGLRPYQFVGTAPGGSITVSGVTYIVAPNGQAAFPDTLEGDRVTDERSIRYLVLAVSMYYQTCTIQCELASGKAWP
jgi:hypothetical protein